MERILVIAPHADDEILGCGALMAKMAKEGKKVFVLVCTNASVGAPELFSKDEILYEQGEDTEDSEDV